MCGGLRVCICAGAGAVLAHRVVVENEGVYVADEEAVDERVGQHLHALGRAVRIGEHQTLHRAAAAQVG